jgi:hypothetical protein
MKKEHTFMTPHAQEVRAETEAYLSSTFGIHTMNVKRIIDAYLQEHPDKAAEALAFSPLNIPKINMLPYAKPLIAEAVAWWQKECAAITMLLD